MDKELAKQVIAKLVKEFLGYPKEELNAKSENQIKSEFIDPLFEALGWDMRKDAEREERVLKGRADYILRIGNQEQLVIEAKKTNVTLTEDEGRQAVSYAYHRKIKFAVLTNFNHIRVYHALSNIKAIDNNLLKKDNNYFRLNFEEFIEKFDLLWLLSKESFEKGEINKLLSAKDEKINKPIDESILEDLLKIREWLSKELKAKKMSLEQEQIDEIVQILIDRLIFIRSVEDRGIEPINFLLSLDSDVRQQRVKLQLFPYLLDKFTLFNKKYDSKLFEPGLLEKEGTFSDDVLHKVITALYTGIENTQSRYMFDLIPGDLFGSIYEQYLGTILAGTEKRVKLDSSSGKRKKMGIYYTPAYIVDYIVKNTVGEYIKNKKIDEILDVTILDPACGSGSFLIHAYQEVCDKVEELLKSGEKSEKWSAFKNYNERLNLVQKVAILINCIYGVDLDEKAVELARLNLLLKVLEGENQDTKISKLPNLTNIKCGNSLIDDPKVSNRAFNWNAQFQEVFKSGGFDVVIGNPPYVRIQTLNRKDVEYFNNNYKSPTKNYDIYLLFVEGGYNLLKKDGSLGFILPHKFFQGEMGINLRNYIYQTKSLNKIVDFTTNQIFENATTYTCLLFLKKQINNAFDYKRFGLGENFTNLTDINFDKLDIDILKENQWNFSNQNVQDILRKIFSQKNKFNEITKKIFKGSSTGNDKIFLFRQINEEKERVCVFSEELNENVWLERKILVPFIYGEDVKRYQEIESKKLLLFPYKIGNGKIFLIKLKELKSDYPLTYNYLFEVKDKLLKRKLNLDNTNFYKYSAGRSLIEYKQPKIMIPDMLVKIRVGYDNKGIYYHGPAIHSVIFKDKYKKLNPLFYLSVLNSKLFWFFISNTSTALRGDTYRLTPEFLNNFRFPEITKVDKSQEQKIVGFVEQMLELQKRVHKENLSGNEKERLEQQIKNVDYEIDEEVYKLYDLTNEEKKIIEESLK